MMESKIIFRMLLINASVNIYNHFELPLQMVRSVGKAFTVGVNNYEYLYNITLKFEVSGSITS